MSTTVLSTWPVLREFDVQARDIDDSGRPGEVTLERLFTRVRGELFDSCTSLTDLFERAGIVPVVSNVRFRRRPGPAVASRLAVSAVVNEIRETTFTARARFRSVSGDGWLAEAFSVHSLQASATGPLPVPRDVRDDFIALARAATQLN